jgi:DNA transposition AAA+ family ATPase
MNNQAIELDSEAQSIIERLTQRDIFVETEQVRLLHERIDEQRNVRQSLRIVGESGTGKTSACKTYVKENQRSPRKGNQSVDAVQYIHTTDNCSSRELFRYILENLKFAMPSGTVGDVRSRVFKALKERQVEVLIVDEADRLKHRTFFDLHDIRDTLEISIVVVGTERLDAVLDKEISIARRFADYYQFGRLEGKKFKETLEIWEEDLLSLPVASNLTSKELLKILYEATGGYISDLDEILKKAAIRSLQAGFKRIDKTILEEVIKGRRTRWKPKR